MVVREHHARAVGEPASTTRGPPWKRKECKEPAEGAKASGVIDFHHFANGNACHVIYSKN